MESSQPLSSQHCEPCEGGVPPLSEAEAREALRALPGWVLEKGAIAKVFSFKNFYETMAFVNAVAFIAHREDHHPDLEVGYKACRVRYRTHAIGGLSQNDLICAAKVEKLL
ncbi:MAG TPA: 4a-hydroxytetrahydrobiopterin dehydratase [bacterium]|nr:4a-hydroxytetrahydrobiopterin dehydratase [bacterium]